MNQKSDVVIQILRIEHRREDVCMYMPTCALCVYGRFMRLAEKEERKYCDAHSVTPHSQSIQIEIGWWWDPKVGDKREIYNSTNMEYTVMNPIGQNFVEDVSWKGVFMSLSDCNLKLGLEFRKAVQNWENLSLNENNILCALQDTK